MRILLVILFAFFFGLALSVKSTLWTWVWAGLSVGCCILFGVVMERNRKLRRRPMNKIAISFVAAACFLFLSATLSFVRTGTEAKLWLAATVMCAVGILFGVSRLLRRKTPRRRHRVWDAWWN